MAKNTKKLPWLRAILFLCTLLMGGVCGVLIARYINLHARSGQSLSQELIAFGGMLLVLALVLLLQIVVHEAGHLLFGLLSGYRFSSFRVASFMVVRTDAGFRFKRLSLAGTGGQCLMEPPDMADGTMPFVLYNLGGSLLNLLSAGICLSLWALLPETLAFLRLFFLMNALVGAAYGLMNGIPLKLGAVNNDGHNALALGKDPAALRSFWLQLKISVLNTRGVRLKDMPEEWFQVPDERGLQNSMTSVLAVFACNRLMDAHQFQTAREQMTQLLTADTAVMGVYQNLLTCDLIYCELLFENRPERLKRMLSRSQRKFMKSMKNFPSVLRTEYTLALLSEQDRKKAKPLKRRFEAIGPTYPYPSDWESERELMELAEVKAG